MILVADNLQITQERIQNAVKAQNPEPIRELVKRCVKAGAGAIDVNSGPLSKTPEKMGFLVETVQSATDLPLLLDTSNPTAMRIGLAACQGRAIINGFSLQAEKLAGILPLAVEFGADIIGYLLYPDSQVPPDSGERLSVAVELFSHFQAAGADPNQLIIDPVLVPLLWQNGNHQAIEILEVLRLLPEILGVEVRTIAGLSNLAIGSGNIEKKRLLEQSYLPMLAAAKLDYCLMNVFHEKTVETARACQALMGAGVFSWESF